MSIKVVVGLDLVGPSWPFGGPKIVAQFGLHLAALISAFSRNFGPKITIKTQVVVFRIHRIPHGRS
jgi:hypothetical protein